MRFVVKRKISRQRFDFNWVTLLIKIRTTLPQHQLNKWDVSVVYSAARHSSSHHQQEALWRFACTPVAAEVQKHVHFLSKATDTVFLSVHLAQINSQLASAVHTVTRMRGGKHDNLLLLATKVQRWATLRPFPSRKACSSQPLTVRETWRERQETLKWNINVCSLKVFVLNVKRSISWKPAFKAAKATTCSSTYLEAEWITL